MTMPDTRPLAHRDDPETSREAADGTREKAPAVKRAILYLLLIAPMSAPEVTREYFKLRVAGGWPDVKPDTIAKRLSELHKDGRVEDSGERRLSPWHRNVVVWRAVL